MKKNELESFLGYMDISVVEAMEMIDKNAKGILFVIDEKRHIIGSVSDGDIRRHLIKTGNLKVSISEIMNNQPITIYKTEISNAFSVMNQNRIHAIPVLDIKNRVSDIILDTEGIKEKEEAAVLPDNTPIVIMAGGKGTRLYPYTKVLPKPLIPIGDIPIMERIINKFRDFSADNFYATVNYKKEMIKSYFAESDDKPNITYVEENVPLGTAGSLKLIDKRFDNPFFVTNCDILINADYSDLYKYHKDMGNALTMVVALKKIEVPYGVAHIGENGALSSMEEKPRLSYFVNTGMYVLNPEVVDFIPEDTFFHMTHLMDELIKNGMKVGTYPISEDSFLDMGEFEEMARMEKKLGKKY